MRRTYGFCIVGLVCLLSLSCSGASSEKLNIVHGTVLHNNQPLGGALVTFHPKDASELAASPPTGYTLEDGTFTLNTGGKEGAPAGEYLVTIICSQIPKNAKGGLSTGGLDTVDILKGAYAVKSKSNISATVTAGENHLEPFNLK